ncbi:MAG: cell division protein ZapA [Pseudomonadota bacterium]
MSSSATPITVQILDKEYRIACPKGEEESLRASADLLNKRINEVRDTGKVIGPDRIVAMTALNLVHELLSERDENEKQSTQFTSKVRNLHERIETAIHSAKQLEL